MEVLDQHCRHTHSIM